MKGGFSRGQRKFLIRERSLCIERNHCDIYRVSTEHKNNKMMENFESPKRQEIVIVGEKKRFNFEVYILTGFIQFFVHYKRLKRKHYAQLVL